MDIITYKTKQKQLKIIQNKLKRISKYISKTMFKDMEIQIIINSENRFISFTTETDGERFNF